MEILIVGFIIRHCDKLIDKNIKIKPLIIFDINICEMRKKTLFPLLLLHLSQNMY